MDRMVWTLILGVVLASTGCPGDDGTTGSDTNAGSSTTPADTSTGNPGTTTDDSMGSSAGPSTGPSTAPETATDGDTTAGNMGGPCDAEPADDECATCVKTMCCTELEDCDADDTCRCFQGCVELNPGAAGVEECNMMCMSADSPFVMGLVTCTVNNCALACI